MIFTRDDILGAEMERTRRWRAHRPTTQAMAPDPSMVPPGYKLTDEALRRFRLLSGCKREERRRLLQRWAKDPCETFEPV